MLQVNKDGWVIDKNIRVMRRPMLAHGPMPQIHGIIVHQTGAATAQSTLDSYLKKGANGAHFLIDKDGTIYQTGSLSWKQWHVGKLRSRCLAEHRCAPVDTETLTKAGPAKTNALEMKKQPPDRYPSNNDSVGIELVGGTVGAARDPDFETATGEQNRSLAWLVQELRLTLGVPLTEVFRHPTVSRKDPHEAESARW
jgi:N-acetyl-anhydromuramyl-L-alanine amidase AmpD